MTEWIKTGNGTSPPQGVLLLVTMYRKSPHGQEYDLVTVAVASWECGRGWEHVDGSTLGDFYAVTHWALMPPPAVTTTEAAARFWGRTIDAWD